MKFLTEPSGMAPMNCDTGSPSLNAMTVGSELICATRVRA
jgi:hypothetical protein